MATQRRLSCTTTHNHKSLRNRGLCDAASAFHHQQLQESKMPRDVVTQVEPAFSAPAAFVRQLMDAVVVRGDAINLIRNGAPSIAGVIKRGRMVSGEGTLEQ